MITFIEVKQNCLIFEEDLASGEIYRQIIKLQEVERFTGHFLTLWFWMKSGARIEMILPESDRERIMQHIEDCLIKC